MPPSPWLSTDPPSCYAALRQDAQELLAALPHLNQREWEKRLRTLFNGDPVLGPLATAWMLSQALKASSKEDAPFWQSQISACKRTAQISHKLHRANEAWGMTPWEVVHHTPHRPLPRYNSAPALK